MNKATPRSYTSGEQICIGDKAKLQGYTYDNKKNGSTYGTVGQLECGRYVFTITQENGVVRNYTLLNNHQNLQKI